MTGQAAVGADIRDRRVNAVIAFALVAAVALTITGWLYDGPPHDYVALAVLTVLTLVTRLVRVRVVERVAVAASGIVSLASCVLVGPVGSAVMLVLAILIERGSIRWPARIFNAALGAILGSVGGIVYLVLGGPRNLTSVSGPGEVLWHVGVPFFAASLAFSLVNFGSIALIVRVDSGASFRSMFFAMLTTSGLAQIGYGVVGLLFVILWVPAQVGPFSALLILIPSSSPNGRSCNTRRRSGRMNGPLPPSSRPERRGTRMPLGTASGLPASPFCLPKAWGSDRHRSSRFVMPRCCMTSAGWVPVRRVQTRAMSPRHPTGIWSSAIPAWVRPFWMTSRFSKTPWKASNTTTSGGTGGAILRDWPVTPSRWRPASSPWRTRSTA